jgi:CRP/FNR family cyclic AMP-dependent transcriptional regulator
MRSTRKADQSKFRPPKAGEFFSFLPTGALKEFQAAVSLVCYPAHKVLFSEQQEASRILILVEGSAKISVNSRDGTRLILWIAKPLELLGLTSVLSGNGYEVTAETVQPCRIASIRRQKFLDFLMRHPAAYQGIVCELTVEMNRACEQMRIMGLSPSASVKLAWLLLEWSAGGRATAHGTSVSISLTHEEMGECIGVTRETVSRAMTDLRQRRLIHMHGAAITITSRFALESFAQGLHRAMPAPSRTIGLSRARLPGIHRREVTEITAGRQA